MTPGSIPYISSIIRKLKSIKNTLVVHNSIPEYEKINDIIGMLRTLADNARLERLLQTGLPLDTGIGFKGTFYAELCLAFHCTFTEPGWFLSVSYLILLCSDLPDVICSLQIHEEQVYLNYAV